MCLYLRPDRMIVIGQSTWKLFNISSSKHPRRCPRLNPGSREHKVHVGNCVTRLSGDHYALCLAASACWLSSNTHTHTHTPERQSSFLSKHGVKWALAVLTHTHTHTAPMTVNAGPNRPLPSNGNLLPCSQAETHSPLACLCTK